MSWSELVNVVGEFMQTHNFHYEVYSGGLTVLIYVFWALGGIWLASWIFSKEVKEVTFNNESEVKNERRKHNNRKHKTKNN